MNKILPKNVINQIFQRLYYLISTLGLMSSDRTINTSSSVMSNGSTRKKSWNGVSSNANNNRGYSPVKSGSSDRSTVPFHDYDSSSDEELFRKPYNDP